MVPDSIEPADLPFRALLHRALASGKLPGDGEIIGAATRAALTVVAQQHPDATAEHVVAAYDAYTIEHRLSRPADGPRPHCPDDRSTQAIDYAATDALITQLTITYPALPRDTIAGVVAELQTTLADQRLRGLNLWRLEYEAHQRLA